MEKFMKMAIEEVERGIEADEGVLFAEAFIAGIMFENGSDPALFEHRSDSISQRLVNYPIAKDDRASCL